MSFFSKIAGKVTRAVKGMLSRKPEEESGRPVVVKEPPTSVELRRLRRRANRRRHREARVIVEYCRAKDITLPPKRARSKSGKLRRPTGFRVKGGWRCVPVY